MFTLKGRKDSFRFCFPNDFIVDEINDKYANILQNQHSFFYKPVDFLNETIRNIDILGFSEASFIQQQPASGRPLRDEKRIQPNRFFHPASDVNYRSDVNPLQLIDKTFNVTFRHTLGFINYFMMFENFWYIYSRDTESEEAKTDFAIEFMDGYGRAYSKVVLMDPVIHSIDMLQLDFTQPLSQSDTFQVVFKYSNIDYQFINVNDEKVFNDYTEVTPF